MHGITEHVRVCILDLDHDILLATGEKPKNPCEPSCLYLDYTNFFEIFLPTFIHISKELDLSNFVIHEGFPLKTPKQGVLNSNWVISYQQISRSCVTYYGNQLTPTADIIIQSSEVKLHRHTSSPFPTYDPTSDLFTLFLF